MDLGLTIVSHINDDVQEFTSRTLGFFSEKDYINNKFDIFYTKAMFRKDIKDLCKFIFEKQRVIGNRLLFIGNNFISVLELEDGALIYKGETDVIHSSEMMKGEKIREGNILISPKAIKIFNTDTVIQDLSVDELKLAMTHLWDVVDNFDIIADIINCIHDKEYDYDSDPAANDNSSYINKLRDQWQMEAIDSDRHYPI